MSNVKLTISLLGPGAKPAPPLPNIENNDNDLAYMHQSLRSQGMIGMASSLTRFKSVLYLHVSKAWAFSDSKNWYNDGHFT